MCGRGRWSGQYTLVQDGDEGPCILQGCHFEVERTGLRHKAEPLCQGRPLLPDYPERGGEGRREENIVSALSTELFFRSPWTPVPAHFIGSS